MKAKNILYLITFICALIIVFVCLFFPIYYDTEFVYDDSGIAIDIISTKEAVSGVFANIKGLFTTTNQNLGNIGSIIFALFLLLLFLGGFALCGLWLFFFIKKKKILPLNVPFICFSIIRIALLGMYLTTDSRTIYNFPQAYIAYWITFAVTIALIILDIVRLALYLKAKYPRQPRAPRPPRPHKPTDKERIAELEKRVQELESKN